MKLDRSQFWKRFLSNVFSPRFLDFNVRYLTFYLNVH